MHLIFHTNGENKVEVDRLISGHFTLDDGSERDILIKDSGERSPWKRVNNSNLPNRITWELLKGYGVPVVPPAMFNKIPCPNISQPLARK